MGKKNKNPHIVCILDRSGSMYRNTQETITGFNDFVSEQKESFPDADLTLVLFNHEYKIVYDSVPIEDVDELTTEDYRASGYTALVYALMKTAKSIKKSQSKKSKTIFLVMTDGLENHSQAYGKKYNKDNAKEVVKELTENGWQFVFIGAGIDAFDEGASLGFSSEHTFSVGADATGFQRAYSSMKSQTLTYFSVGPDDDSDPVGEVAL